MTISQLHQMYFKHRYVLKTWWGEKKDVFKNCTNINMDKPGLTEKKNEKQTRDNPRIFSVKCYD